LLEAFFSVTGIDPLEPSFVQAHRWRFALPSAEVGDMDLFDRDKRVALAGDWTAGSKVQGAFLSGMAAAGRIAALQFQTSYAN
jgi:predicted NAD/FAD-dependent oxidoreductase